MGIGGKESANRSPKSSEEQKELERKAISRKEERHYWKVRKLKSAGMDIHLHGGNG